MNTAFAFWGERFEKVSGACCSSARTVRVEMCQVLQSAASFATSPELSHHHAEGISVSGLCACLCASALIWPKHSCKVCILLQHFHFLMSRCHGKGRCVRREVSWQQITCCFRRADTQARCCCGRVCHRSLSLSQCVWRFESSWVFATSPLQWWIVTELWYLRLPEDSLILHSPPLHSSSLWHSWVN